MRRGLMGWNEDELPSALTRRGSSGCRPRCGRRARRARSSTPTWCGRARCAGSPASRPTGRGPAARSAEPARRCSPPRCRSASPTGSAHRLARRDRQHAEARHADRPAHRAAAGASAFSSSMRCRPGSMTTGGGRARGRARRCDAAVRTARRGVDEAERRLIARARCARGRGARSGGCSRAHGCGRRSPAWSRSTRGLTAQRKPISRLRLISISTAG